MRYIQYQGETLPPSAFPPSPFLLAFHLVLHNFYIYANPQDACQGDSGGPLVRSHSIELLGLVSYGYGILLFSMVKCGLDVQCFRNDTYKIQNICQTE